MKGLIYALENPIDGKIFYIGATTKSLQERLDSHYQHLNEAIKGSRPLNKRLTFLKELLPIKATIKLLQKCEDNLYDLEVFYISKFTEEGYSLLNETKGGQGGLTTSFKSEEELKQIYSKISNANSGKSKPEGFAEHLSEIRKGKGNPAYGKTKYEKVGVFTRDNKFIKQFESGVEVDEFRNSRVYGSIIKKLNKNEGICSYHGYIWKYISKYDVELNDEQIEKLFFVPPPPKRVSKKNKTEDIV